MSIRSNSEGASRGKMRKVVTYGYGDAFSLAVARTKENYGKKFYGCPNYHVEGEDCGFFKWYEEEDGNNSNNRRFQSKRFTEQGQMKALLEVIVGLLVIIVVMLIVVVVKIHKHKHKQSTTNINIGIHYIYHNVWVKQQILCCTIHPLNQKLHENNWINGAPSGCKS
ncbi:hypothetical protein LXL04_033590 [Taraxacum kok-saghyz]